MKRLKIYRQILLASLFLLAFQYAYSQISFGVRAGVSRSAMVQKIDLNYYSGWSVGSSVAGLLDVPLYQRFSLRPELALTYQGGSYMSGFDKETEVYGKMNSFNGYSLQPSFNLAFNIPISGVKMSIYLGPALDLHLSDRFYVSIDDEPAAHVKEQIRTFDFAINSGIGVEYKGFFFSINALNGTLDRRKVKIDDEPAVFQNNLTFSLGYFFR